MALVRIAELIDDTGLQDRPIGSLIICARTSYLRQVVAAEDSEGCNMKALVLAYHSHNISGDGYAENDHVALASDLRTITRRDVRIVPLVEIVRHLEAGLEGPQSAVMAAITFDDGPVFDHDDFLHPRFGAQRSFLNILSDFRSEHGEHAQPELHATSFVIASPDARKAMEKAEDCGFAYLQNWLSDEWWAGAAKSGLIDVGNHSWDHVHHAPETIAISVDVRDNFELVNNYTDADREIRRATDFIEMRMGARCRHFAFPFGHVNRYLLEEYLPERSAEHRMEAAFSTAGRPIERTDSIWNIPRLVCGYHWRSSDELEALLAA